MNVITKKDFILDHHSKRPIYTIHKEIELGAWFYLTIDGTIIGNEESSFYRGENLTVSGKGIIGNTLNYPFYDFEKEYICYDASFLNIVNSFNTFCEKIYNKYKNIEKRDYKVNK